jgi:hypothetical protein
MSGNEGFKTKADAEKVAQFVTNRIRKDGMPSTFIDEVENLKSLKNKFSHFSHLKTNT